MEAGHSGGLPLGIAEEAVYGTESVELGKEPVSFFCYTDGVIEAMDPEQNMYGVERLAKCLVAAENSTPQALLGHVRTDLTGFVGGAPQSDDITMLAVRID